MIKCENYYENLMWPTVLCAVLYILCFGGKVETFRFISGSDLKFVYKYLNKTIKTNNFRRFFFWIKVNKRTVYYQKHYASEKKANGSEIC